MLKNLESTKNYDSWLNKESRLVGGLYVYFNFLNLSPFLIWLIFLQKNLFLEVFSKKILFLKDSKMLFFKSQFVHANKKLAAPANS